MEKKQGKNKNKKGPQQGQGPQGQQQPQQQQKPQTSGGAQQGQGPQQQQTSGGAQVRPEGGDRPAKGAWKDKQKKPKQEQQQQSGAPQGPQGQQKPQAQQGPQGPQGQQRPQGAQGQQGPQGQQKPQQQQPQQQHRPQQQPQHPQQQQHRPQQPQQQHPQQRPGPQKQPQHGQRSESVASRTSQQSGPSQNTPPQESMMKKMEKLSLAEANFPVRPSVSLSGNFQKQVIATNYLKLNLSKLPDIIYHYDIKFDPDRPKKFLFPAFRTLIQQHLPQILNKAAFDGASSFFSKEKIENGEFPKVTVPSPDGGRAKDFKITIQFATAVDMRVIKEYPNYSAGHLQQAIQALDIILRSAHDKEGLIRHKRSVFAPPKQQIKMKDNYELLIGLYQSFVMGERPYLNVDVSHKAFPSGAASLFPLYQESRNIEDCLRGLSLVYTSPMTGERKTYKFNRIRGRADQETFKDEQDNGKTKTIAQYFAEKGHRLRNPDAPVLHIGPAAKTILIPMEFLSIPPGQAMNGKAPESCTRDMVRVAATSTDVRKGKIMDLLRNINYKGVETIRQFGMIVGEDFIDVNSHILNPPQLQYKNEVVRIRKPGVWEGAKFIDPNKCKKWGIFVLDNRARDQDVKFFGEGIVKEALRMGLEFDNFNPLNVEKALARGRLNKNDYDQIINRFKQNGIELLFVIISGFSADHYPEVKKSAELRCGMLTQCVKSQTLERMNGSTLANILLKVNAKLGGSNQFIASNSKVSLDKRPFMVIGADVTHPSPDQQNIPSVVGVAASYDVNGFRYNCQWRIQSPRDETIRDLEEIVVQHLRVFKEKHNRLPVHILYYRDGVSEGQFPEIKEIELVAIQNACKKMGGPENNIRVTVIVVQKRHHTRFFPKQQNRADKNNNVMPGTVVDSEIVDSNKKWQFFMVSHQSIQGVAKPTKYCVIHDEADVTNEDLQVFTYNLCHLFTRCNRSVSYVAPTYYAHLVAARGRVYIYNERIDFHQLKRENDMRQVKREVIADRPMYFV